MLSGYVRAALTRGEKAPVRVHGDFVARIVQDEPPAEQTAQMALLL
jgi:hypothetical protein